MSESLPEETLAELVEFLDEFRESAGEMMDLLRARLDELAEHESEIRSFARRKGNKSALSLAEAIQDIGAGAEEIWDSLEEFHERTIPDIVKLIEEETDELD